MVRLHVDCAALQPTPWASVPVVLVAPCVQVWADAGHVCCVHARVHDFVHPDAAVVPAGDVYPELHAVHAPLFA